MTMLLHAGKHYLSNIDRSKDDFSAHSFYMSSAYYAGALQVYISEPSNLIGPCLSWSD